MNNGKISLRIPKSLHQRLLAESKAERVSLNQYIMYCLSRNEADYADIYCNTEILCETCGGKLEFGGSIGLRLYVGGKCKCNTPEPNDCPTPECPFCTECKHEVTS